MSPTKKESFSAEEKAAMRARAKELKAAAQGEEAIDAVLAEMTPSDRALGKKIHAIVKETAPGLTPKTWYGMVAVRHGAFRVSTHRISVTRETCCGSSSGRVSTQVSLPARRSPRGRSRRASGGWPPARSPR